MASRVVPSLRALPRAFVAGIPDELPEKIELPEAETRKFRNVLRLVSGDVIGLLPGDGRFIRCTLDGKSARPIEVTTPATEAKREVTLALGIPKPEKLEESVRMATELGVAHFLLFTAERTVVRWEPAKFAAKLLRLETIAREAAEVAFRTKLPTFTVLMSLAQVLEAHPQALVMSESETAPADWPTLQQECTIVVGPEGGWAPKEVQSIGSRAVSLGPRVLRVDTAVAAACSLALADR
ncbi:MAG: 16S rRNA (uracil(1498)-N(3))-methyltransferase [Armatimonadetes bacterium]|nr:16S rRNA (uracil(1498)-N(3))-methyltransferase [Armatimonadota bacterium]